MFHLAGKQYRVVPVPQGSPRIHIRGAQSIPFTCEVTQSGARAPGFDENDDSLGTTELLDVVLLPSMLQRRRRRPRDSSAPARQIIIATRLPESSVYTTTYFQRRRGGAL